MKSHYRHFHKINDMTSRTIRDNAKILAEKRRLEEAPQIQETDQLSRAHNLVKLDITPVMEPIQPSPSIGRRVVILKTSFTNFV